MIPTAENGAPILEARAVEKRFGALVVLDNVGFQVPAGGAVGIIGPNGAGKTTLLDILAGAQRPNQGTVEFRGGDVTSLGASARCRLGVGRTHQVPRPFTDMTVFENALVGAGTGAGLKGADAQEKAIDALARSGLLPRGNRRAETLGLLDRKRLEMARALATDPTVLLLDEIAGGLTDEETHELVETIQGLCRDGVAIVWIEHVVHALVRVAQSLVCMSAGQVIAEGDPKAVMSNPQVMEAYMGAAT